MSLAARLATAAARRIGRWDFTRASARGRALGRLAYRLDGRHRTVAQRNLRLAFPERDADWHRTVALGSFEQAGRTAIEMLWSPRLQDHQVTSIIEPAGIEKLQRAVAAGTGGIIAGSHYGNWELMGPALTALGIPLVSVARPLDDPGLERLVYRLRTTGGAEVIPKANALRGVLRALGKGKVVALLIDQNTQRHEAVFVPFFHELAATTPALGHLHLRTGAPIFPSFAVPSGNGYRLVIEDPLVVSAGDRDRVIREVTAKATARIEEHVRACPEAWLWMHDRWRERPEN